MSMNITFKELISAVLFISSITGGLLYYIYQGDNNISSAKMQEYRQELKDLKKDYSDGLDRMDRDRIKDKDLFLNRIDSMGRGQAVILEKIYQQSIISTKSVNEVRIEMAKSASNSIVLNSKIDRVLELAKKNEGINTTQRKAITRLQVNMSSVNKVIEEISKDKGISFLNLSL